MEDKTKLITFLDVIGRTVIGEKVGETPTHITIKNPVIVHVTPQQEGGQVRMALQLFPLFFKEFLGDKSAGIVFEYNKNNVSLAVNNPVLDWKLNGQYAALFVDQPAQMAPAPAAQQTDVIKLFDD